MTDEENQQRVPSTIDDIPESEWENPQTHDYVRTVLRKRLGREPTTTEIDNFMMSQLSPTG